MKRKLYFLSLTPLLALLVSASGTSASGGQQLSRSSELDSPLSTAFTYQGRLEDANGPVSNTCDLEFGLFGSPGGSDQLGSTLPREDVLVVDGYFTVDDLDFGAGVFQGEARWLEIAVRCPSGTGTFEKLSPRQALTASPYALYALSSGSTYTAGEGLTLSGTQFSVNTSLIQARVDEACPNGSAIRAIDQDGMVTCQGVSGTAGGDITAVWTGDGLLGGNDVGDITLEVDTDYLQRRVRGTCSPGSSIRVINPDGTVSCETDNNTTTFWGLSGSSGTNPESNYLGTSDNQPLVLRVNATDALRLEPTSGTPNLVGGFLDNSVTTWVEGAVIAGGGTIDYINRVTDNFGTVGGGAGNTASGIISTVGGGLENTASGHYSTVGGGEGNTASEHYSTVGGGYDNTASGSRATVPGGYDNEATGDYSFAAGRRAKANKNGAFVWADSSDFDFTSPLINSFSARATGGFELVANINDSGGTTWSCVFANGISWSCSSDREQKENFQAVDNRAVLEKVSQLPVQYWNAKGVDPAVKHLGPTAQDFSAAFGLGDDDTHIATIDLDGVSLAAIQGLYQLSQEQQARIAALESKLDSQQGHIEALETRLAALEGAALPGQTAGLQRLGYLPYFGFAALGFGIALWARKRGGAG